MNTVVLGGTGFVGRRLIPRLLADGHRVTVVSRHGGRRHNGVRSLRGDISDPRVAARVVRGADVVIYLVHSLDQSDFAERDRRAAENIGSAAARAGVGRIVYLGGLGSERDHLSAHLASRREVEHILAAAVPTVALRAGIVVGPGGSSWEMLCQLVERIPGLLAPSWVSTRTSPIALDDVVEFLAASVFPDVPPGHYDIGAPDTVTFARMVSTVGRLMRKPMFRVVGLPVPVPTALGAIVLRALTDADSLTATALLESAVNPTVVRERRLEAITGHRPMRWVDAAAQALAERVVEAAGSVR